MQNYTGLPRFESKMRYNTHRNGAMSFILQAAEFYLVLSIILPH